MTETFIFDWVVLAPIEEVAAQAEAVCVERGLGGLWYMSTSNGIPVKGCRITSPAGDTLAVLTLQGYEPGRSHLRLQPAARAVERGAEVGALADMLYARLQAASAMPGAPPSPDGPPRFIRPPGFEARPGIPADPE